MSSVLAPYTTFIIQVCISTPWKSPGRLVRSLIKDELSFVERNVLAVEILLIANILKI